MSARAALWVRMSLVAPASSGQAIAAARVATRLFIESCADRGVLEQVLLDCGFEPQLLTLDKSGSARGMRDFRATFETEGRPIAG